MDFLFTHWWIATTIPYFVFNVWLASIFERDEPDLFEGGLNDRIILYCVGLFIVIICFVWVVLSCIVDLSRAQVKMLIKHTLVGVAVTLLYILLTASTDYQPNRYVAIGELLTVWALASYVLHSRTKP